MKYWLLTFCLGTLFSCDRRSKLEELFNNAAFDATVIANLPLYDSLKNIMIKNIDTIVKFRNSRKEERTKNFYIFNYTEPKASNEGIDDLPAFIYPVVEKICDQIGKENLLSFALYPDSAITISVKSIYTQRVNASINHQLYWKTRFGLDPEYDFFIRDTLLAPQWTYYVSEMNVLIDKNNIQQGVVKSGALVLD